MTQENPLLTQIKNNNFTHKIFQQKPVPLMELIKEIGLNGVGTFNSEEDQDYTNVLGFVDTEQKLIGVNVSESLTTQRFTIAHEIAHLALHSDHDETVFYRKHFPIDSRDFNYMPAIEKQANQFAGRILMPEDSIKALLDPYKNESILYKIRVVMNNFLVSYTAVRIRLQELGMMIHD